MAKEIVIKPRLCLGCSLCSLSCSMQNTGEFKPSLAYIRITRMDFEGKFDITFSSSCRGCGVCARACPSGALRLVDVS
ncbi:MAG: 4Fe-4S dicluster domain-containing protein [Bacillota bacterium]